MAPEPRDVSWRNLVIPYRVLPLCRLGVIVAASLLTIFFAIPVTAVQGIAKFEKLKKWFPPAMALQLILPYLNGSRFNISDDTINGTCMCACGEGFNNYGGIYVQRNPRLKVKVVDGSSLAVAVILNSIPKGTTQVLLTGNLTKVAYALAFSLCQRDIQVVTLQQAEYLKLTKSLNGTEGKVVHDRSYAQKIWLVGDGLSKKEQLSAPKGTSFVPFSQFPPKQLRRDCLYHYTPAMKIPKSLENVYSCENWLPRRVMSASRIAGIVHALEGWNEHECGHTMSSIDKVWQATLRHGFQPLVSKEAKID
ncbi:very-long-chain aldehyde decarbonylase CER1-like [Rosa rugosa]|uniref:very-long-chain aldehyde decarbonylase CER1-like n=1 Tax=Rosa rugosa TaxID=74645 RepID=UPI002B408D60|nr:very-long-chain aldehyde decarbonylase CER1-like [Rosa rugosa]